MEKHYNLTFLNDYFDNDLASMLPILKMYIEETPKEILKIEELLHQKNTAGVKAATHKIKTNVAMLGIHEKSSFINDMHLLKPTDAITEHVLQQFEIFRSAVNFALRQIHNDFFVKQ